MPAGKLIGSEPTVDTPSDRRGQALDHVVPSLDGCRKGDRAVELPTSPEHDRGGQCRLCSRCRIEFVHQQLSPQIVELRVVSRPANERQSGDQVVRPRARSRPARSRRHRRRRMRTRPARSVVAPTARRRPPARDIAVTGPVSRSMRVRRTPASPRRHRGARRRSRVDWRTRSAPRRSSTGRPDRPRRAARRRRGERWRSVGPAGRRPGRDRSPGAGRATARSRRRSATRGHRRSRSTPVVARPPTRIRRAGRAGHRRRDRAGRAPLRMLRADRRTADHRHDRRPSPGATRRRVRLRRPSPATAPWSSLTRHRRRPR